MRGTFYLLSVLIAVSSPESFARSGFNDSCEDRTGVEARLVCRIKVRVTINNDGSCVALAPDVIKVRRNRDKHPVLMLFFIGDYDSNEELKFDPDPKVGVRIAEHGNVLRIPRADHFEDPTSQGRRVVLVVDKNPIINNDPTLGEKFDYAIKVWNGTTPCSSPDPLIHNTN